MLAPQPHTTPGSIDVGELPVAAITEYARIPIAFEVKEVFDVPESPTGGYQLTLRQVAEPYEKDYDANSSDTPMSWAQRFDTSKWGLLAARAGSQIVGGATVAYETPGMEMLEDRSDLAVLWDLRVVPSMRRHGIGSALFEAAEAWALARHGRELKVETQNNNVPACRFYARQGCVLRAVNRGVYRQFPEEIQLLWYKTLAGG